MVAAWRMADGISVIRHPSSGMMASAAGASHIHHACAHTRAQHAPLGCHACLPVLSAFLSMSACAPSLQFTKLYQHLMGLPMDGSLRTNAIIVVSQGAAVPGQPVPEDKSVELIEKAQLATQLHLQVDGPLAATNTYHGLRFVGKLAADVVDTCEVPSRDAKLITPQGVSIGTIGAVTPNYFFYLRPRQCVPSGRRHHLGLRADQDPAGRCGRGRGRRRRPSRIHDSSQRPTRRLPIPCSARCAITHLQQVSRCSVADWKPRSRR